MTDRLCYKILRIRDSCKLYMSCGGGIDKTGVMTEENAVDFFRCFYGGMVYSSPMDANRTYLHCTGCDFNRGGFDSVAEIEIPQTFFNSTMQGFIAGILGKPEDLKLE